MICTEKRSSSQTRNLFEFKNVDIQMNTTVSKWGIWFKTCVPNIWKKTMCCIILNQDWLKPKIKFIMVYHNIIELLYGYNPSHAFFLPWFGGEPGHLRVRHDLATMARREPSGLNSKNDGAPHSFSSRKSKEHKKARGSCIIISYVCAFLWKKYVCLKEVGI